MEKKQAVEDTNKKQQQQQSAPKKTIINNPKKAVDSKDPSEKKNFNGRSPESKKNYIKRVFNMNSPEVEKEKRKKNPPPISPKSSSSMPSDQKTTTTTTTKSKNSNENAKAQQRRRIALPENNAPEEEAGNGTDTDPKHKSKFKRAKQFTTVVSSIPSFIPSNLNLGSPNLLENIKNSTTSSAKIQKKSTQFPKEGEFKTKITAAQEIIADDADSEEITSGQDFFAFDASDSSEDEEEMKKLFASIDSVKKSSLSPTRTGKDLSKTISSEKPKINDYEVISSSSDEEDMEIPSSKEKIDITGSDDIDFELDMSRPDIEEAHLAFEEEKQEKLAEKTEKKGEKNVTTEGKIDNKKEDKNAEKQEKQEKIEKAENKNAEKQGKIEKTEKNVIAGGKVDQKKEEKKAEKKVEKTEKKGEENVTTAGKVDQKKEEKKVEKMEDSNVGKQEKQEKINEKLMEIEKQEKQEKAAEKKGIVDDKKAEKPENMEIDGQENEKKVQKTQLLKEITEKPDLKQSEKAGDLEKKQDSSLTKEKIPENPEKQAKQSKLMPEMMEIEPEPAVISKDLEPAIPHSSEKSNLEAQIPSSPKKSLLNIPKPKSAATEEISPPSPKPQASNEDTPKSPIRSLFYVPKPKEQENEKIQPQKEDEGHTDAKKPPKEQENQNTEQKKEGEGQVNVEKQQIAETAEKQQIAEDQEQKQQKTKKDKKKKSKINKKNKEQEQNTQQKKKDHQSPYSSTDMFIKIKANGLIPAKDLQDLEMKAQEIISRLSMQQGMRLQPPGLEASSTQGPSKIQVYPQFVVDSVPNQMDVSNSHFYPLVMLREHHFHLQRNQYLKDHPSEINFIPYSFTEKGLWQNFHAHKLNEQLTAAEKNKNNEKVQRTKKLLNLLKNYPKCPRTFLELESNTWRDLLYNFIDANQSVDKTDPKIFENYHQEQQDLFSNYHYNFCQELEVFFGCLLTERRKNRIFRDFVVSNQDLFLSFVDNLDIMDFSNQTGDYNDELDIEVLNQQFETTIHSLEAQENQEISDSAIRSEIVDEFMSLSDDESGPVAPPVAIRTPKKTFARRLIDNGPHFPFSPSAEFNFSLGSLPRLPLPSSFAQKQKKCFNCGLHGHSCESCLFPYEDISNIRQNVRVFQDEKQLAELEKEYNLAKPSERLHEMLSKIRKEEQKNKSSISEDEEEEDEQITENSNIENEEKENISVEKKTEQDNIAIQKKTEKEIIQESSKAKIMFDKVQKLLQVQSSVLNDQDQKQDEILTVDDEENSTGSAQLPILIDEETSQADKEISQLEIEDDEDDDVMFFDSAEDNLKYENEKKEQEEEKQRQKRMEEFEKKYQLIKQEKEIQKRKEKEAKQARKLIRVEIVSSKGRIKVFPVPMNGNDQITPNTEYVKFLAERLGVSESRIGNVLVVSEAQRKAQEEMKKKLEEFSKKKTEKRKKMEIDNEADTLVIEAEEISAQKKGIKRKRLEVEKKHKKSGENAQIFDKKKKKRRIESKDGEKNAKIKQTIPISTLLSKISVLSSDQNNNGPAIPPTSTYNSVFQQQQHPQVTTTSYYSFTSPPSTFGQGFPTQTQQQQMQQQQQVPIQMPMQSPMFSVPKINYSHIFPKPPQSQPQKTLQALAKLQQQQQQGMNQSPRINTGNPPAKQQPCAPPPPPPPSTPPPQQQQQQRQQSFFSNPTPPRSYYSFLGNQPQQQPPQQ